MAERAKTHYETLGVAPSAAKADLDRAYLALKTAGVLGSHARWELERAYLTLCDPGLRRRYDDQLENAASTPTGPKAGEAPAAAGSRPTAGSAGSRARPLDRAPLLGLLLVLLSIVVWRAVWPVVGWRFRSDPVGTELLLRDRDVPLGVVVRSEAAHDFGSGIRADAYQIRLSGSQEEKWFTRAEVNRATRRHSR